MTESEHHHHSYDWEGQLLALRAEATHFYEHGFDWRGHAPPDGYVGPRWYAPAPDWRLDATLDASAPGTGTHVEIATSTGKLRDMVVAGQLVFAAQGEEHRLTAFLS